MYKYELIVLIPSDMRLRFRGDTGDMHLRKAIKLTSRPTRAPLVFSDTSALEFSFSQFRGIPGPDPPEELPLKSMLEMSYDRHTKMLRVVEATINATAFDDLTLLDFLRYQNFNNKTVWIPATVNEASGYHSLLFVMTGRAFVDYHAKHLTLLLAYVKSLSRSGGGTIYQNSVTQHILDSTFPHDSFRPLWLCYGVFSANDCSSIVFTNTHTCRHMGMQDLSIVMNDR